MHRLRASATSVVLLFAVGLLLTPGCLAAKPPGALSPAGEVPTDSDESPPAPEKRNRPAPPGARKRVKERARMVDSQMAQPPDGRPAIRSDVVLEAMRVVPRHEFIPRKMRRYAYADSALPIGHDQTISQPFIVAWMTELLALDSDDKVLEIGTGSGYQAAVLAHITEHVYSIEIVPPLFERARKVLKKQGYTEIKLRQGDGYFGWKENAPFDAIIATCAADNVPSPLWEQLAPGGRMVIPVGSPESIQQLVVLTKTADGKRQTRRLGPVRFVPLTRSKEPARKAESPAEKAKSPAEKDG